MSIPHNHPPRIGQKFEYCGAVIEYVEKIGLYRNFKYIFFSTEFGRIEILDTHFAEKNLKALT
jgi:hypothetical protein